MCTDPTVGTSRPASKASSVVLPEPEAPRMATASPAGISNDTSCRIVSVVAPVETCFVKPAAFTMGGMRSFAMRVRLFLLLLSLAAFPAQAARQTIVIFGDSLSAGYGLSQGSGWVDLLGQRLQRDKLDYDVVNASISGETTLGGRNRVDGMLETHKPAVVVVELGANDGLRGATVESTRANLAAIVAACHKAGAKALVVGMRIPPNYGPVYT